MEEKDSELGENSTSSKQAGSVAGAASVNSKSTKSNADHAGRLNVSGSSVSGSLVGGSNNNLPRSDSQKSRDKFEDQFGFNEASVDESVPADGEINDLSLHENEEDDDDEDLDERGFEAENDVKTVLTESSFELSRESSASVKLDGAKSGDYKRTTSQRTLLLQGSGAYMSAKAEAIQRLEALGVEEDDDRFHAIQFEDRLVIVTEELDREVGEFSVSVSAAQYRHVGECIKVTATSRGFIDEVACGTTVTAYLTKKLLTLEQQHHEYIKFQKNPVDRKTVIVRREDHYQVELFEANTNKRVSRILRHDEMRGVIPEGADLVLQRLLVLYGDLTDPLSLVTVDSNLQWCHVAYSIKDGQIEKIGDTEAELTLIERTIFKTEDAPTTFLNYYTLRGHLMRRQQVGAPILMKVKIPYRGRTIDELGEKKVIVLKSLNWEEDLELQSKYCDRVEELKSVHRAYLRDHADVGNILADFIQAVLVQKPDDILQFAAKHFTTFLNPYHLQQQQQQQAQLDGSAEYGAGASGGVGGRVGGSCVRLDSTQVDLHPHCRTTARLRFLIKALRSGDIGAYSNNDD